MKTRRNTSLTRDHDEQLHEVVVDRRRAGTLDDEDVLISHRAVDLHRRLEREELGDVAWREGDTEAEGAARSGSFRRRRWDWQDEMGG